MKVIIAYPFLWGFAAKVDQTDDRCQLVGQTLDLSDQVKLSCDLDCDASNSIGTCDRTACLGLVQHCMVANQYPSPLCVANQMPASWVCNWSCVDDDGDRTSCYNPVFPSTEPSTQATTLRSTTAIDSTPTIQDSTPTIHISTETTTATTTTKHIRVNKAASPTIISAFGGTIGAVAGALAYGVYRHHGSNADDDVQPAREVAEAPLLRGHANNAVGGGGNFAGGSPNPVRNAGNMGFDAGVCQNQSFDEVMDNDSSSSEEENCSSTTEFKNSVASKFFEDMIRPFS